MFRRFGVLRSSVATNALGVTEAVLKRLKEITAGSSSVDRAVGREVMHVQRCNMEIMRLLQIPEVRMLLGGSVDALPTISSADLIQRTAFSPSALLHGRNDVHVHDAGCPIQAGDMSVSTIFKSGSAPGVLPCKHCLRRRLNYLASEHFAHGLYWSSIMPQPNSGNHISNQKVYQLVRESFGSMKALEDTLAEFAVNRRDGGFTWLVYNPLAVNVKAGSGMSAGDGSQSPASLGRLEVVNLPGATSPVVLGMWPVLCVNVSTDVIVDAFNDADAAANASPSEVAHSWSRAARNPSSTVTRTNAVKAEKTLGDLRRAVASRQSKALDIAFMESQVQAALNYFASEAYQTATTERRKQLTAEAQQRVVKTFDNVELDAINEMKKAAAAKAKAASDAAAAAAAKPAAASAKATTATAAAATAAATATTASTSSAAAESSAQPTAAAAATTTPAAAPAEPAEDVIVQEGLSEDRVTRFARRASGIITYYFENGTSTDVFPDGRQINYTPELTTTTYPNGTLHYLYANGATVEIRSDGTKYINGELSSE